MNKHRTFSIAKISKGPPVGHPGIPIWRAVRPISKEPIAMEEVAGLEAAKRNAMWGTYGKPFRHPVRWVRLIDCSTDHLEAILQTEYQIRGGDYETIIRSILQDRSSQ
jgi:hypothetical protein